MGIMKTFKWSCTVGTNSGYDLSEQRIMSEEEFIGRYQKVAELIEKKHKVYITATITSSRTIYKAEWGCPKEGEFTYTLSGSCNPVFSDVEKYKSALVELIGELRKEFDQSTLLLEMVPAEVIYDREDK